MIHQHIFASPRPGMTEEEFQKYWVEVHAVKYASKIRQIKKYLIDTRIPLDSDEGEPLYSGIAEIWLENDEEQLASLQSKEFLQGARLDEPNWAAFWKTLVLDTDANVMLEGPPLERGQDWVKLVYYAKRKEGMSLPEFRKMLLGPQAEKTLAIPGLRRHLLCTTRDSWYFLGEPRFDMLGQLWFDDIEALEEARASTEYKQGVIGADNLFELKYVFSIVVKEHWILGPEAR